MIFIYSWPSWLLIVIELVVVVGLAVGGHVVVRRFVPYRDLARHNDVTGFVLAIVGVVYAVLLAFVVVVAWEGFNTAARTASAEEAAASDLYRVSSHYKEPYRTEMRRAILEYADLLEKKEWPLMSKGEESPEANLLADHILNLAIDMVDSDTTHRSAVDDSVITLSHAFLDGRRARLNMNQEGIPSALWIGLVVGALLTIAFTYLFGVENFRLQLVMTGLLAALIGIMFSMIVTLDYPFRGGASVSTEPWTLMIERLKAEHLTP